LKPKLVCMYVCEFNPYLKNTTLHYYKDKLVIAVQGNNPCLPSESYETHKYEMQCHRLLAG
jgi:hypothetical protein